MSILQALQFRKKAGVTPMMEAVMATLKNGPLPVMLILAECQRHRLCSVDSARMALELAKKKKYVRQLMPRGDGRIRRLALTPKGGLYFKLFEEHWNGKG